LLLLLFAKFDSLVLDEDEEDEDEEEFGPVESDDDVAVEFEAALADM
jgi:hypothetical protein